MIFGEYRFESLCIQEGLFFDHARSDASELEAR